MTRNTHYVKVEGRVRFGTPDEAQRVVGYLQQRDSGTVFDLDCKSRKVHCAGQSVRLSWEGQAGQNDHEHTYMWLSEAVEHAQQGCFVVSGDEADTVFCVPEAGMFYSSEHLNMVVATLWGECYESEFLRDHFSCGDLPVILDLWNQLDTWAAKSWAIVYIFDCTDVQHTPEQVKTILTQLWETPPPTERSAEAESLAIEEECYWMVQALSVDRYQPKKEGQIYRQIANILEGEERLKFYEQARATAQSCLYPQA